jgi:hypothetical protein
MRKLALLVPLIVAAVVAGVLLHSPQADAEDVLARALDASTNAPVQLGDYTWIDNAGIGIKLPAAPVTDSFPRLLAGERADSAHSAALWECGPKGFSALQKKLQADGASFGGSEPWPFRPRGRNEEIAGHRSGVSLPQGRTGIVIDWDAAGRRFAVVVEASSRNQAERRADELLREMVAMPGVKANGIAPLIDQGRYACVLNGWTRDGERFRRASKQGWLSLRIFQVALTDFENINGLQLELENKLVAAGFKRSAGMSPNIGGNPGSIREYFGGHGYVQRIAYARLEGGYMVALMQAPEAQRKPLSGLMDDFAQSIRDTGMGATTGPRPLLFNSVRNIRCIAWQDGRRVLWGVLFNDSRNQPVLWRQDGIAWDAQLLQRGQVVVEEAGNVNSSRALNPLVDADARQLQLPEKFEGDVELEVTVGGELTKITLTIK